MDIEVDNERAADPALSLQAADRHSDIIEHAEPLAMVGECVVRAAREVPAETLL